MYANILNMFTVFWLILPGLWLAQRPMAVNAKLLAAVLLVQLAVFTSIGLICKILPNLIDPRIKF